MPECPLPFACVPTHDELEREVSGLYEEYANALLNYAATLALDREASRDAVQEVFLRYVVERRCGRSADNPRAWLYRVLHNELLDRLKTPASRYEVPADGTEELPDSRANAETQIRRRQAARQIASLLSPRELDCLRLRAEGYAYGEIAVALGVHLGTAGALLTRAYGKLRRAAGADDSLRASTADALGCLFRGGRPPA
jgi:RNA polymerase sigma-70 factor, ECF subfamily